MPFTVKPSDQLVIDWSEAGPEDALRIVTAEPPATFFCMIHQEGDYRRLGLVPGAIPVDIRRAARSAARELLQSLVSLSQKELDEVEQWFNEQQDIEDDLLEVVTNRMLMLASVRGGETIHDKLNIGTSLVVRFPSVDVIPFRHSGRLTNHDKWTAAGTISQIVPTKRFAAVMFAAARY